MATEVLVPPLGQTVDSVTLVAWYKQPGDPVQQGEMLFAIETDKATLDIEAPTSGVLRQVSARPGDEVRVLTAIALIAAPDEQVQTKELECEPAAVPVLSQLRPEVPPRSAGERIFISPRARRLAEEHGVAWATLPSTGPEGAIVERDVRAYLAAQSQPELPPAARAVTRPLDDVEVAGSDLLEAIPQRMALSSRTAACVTLNTEADATTLVDLRRQLADDGLKVSYNALWLYLLGRALRDHPRLNASLVDDAIQVWRSVHIGLAVDSDRGLLVPVVRDVDRKGLAQLAEEAGALAGRARAGTCTPEELSGGTFTLTNLGMYGIDSFTPIINLPECAILGVGRIRTQPAFAGDQVAARQMVWLSLSFDHRLVDGAPAARFLQRVVQLVELPYLLLA